jgi:2'-5' RNA ligase
MRRLVVVLPLQPLPDGVGFSLRDWPLHITVAPTFSVHADLTSVVSAITPSLSAQPVLRVRAGRDEGFGRSMNRPATVVDPSVELTDLHARLVAALRQSGAEFDHPDFVDAGYRAHVTKTRIDSVVEGDVLELRQAAIVDMAPQGDQRLRQVVWTTMLR